MTTPGVVVYDLAVSFAGEHRKYVEEVVRACEKLELKVFYDRNMNNDWWGKSFIREQRKIYGSQTRYFVPFISVEYLAKPIPKDEFSAAMMTAVEKDEDFILPILIGDVRVPPDLLHPHTHYLHAEDYNPIQLAEQLRAKVARARSSGQPVREIGAAIQQAMEIRMPKVTPAQFSKHEELQSVFNFFRSQFEIGMSKLHSLDFKGTVMGSDERISVRVESRGEALYALEITKGSGWGDDKLSFSVGPHRMASNSTNGWVTPFFDKEAGHPKLRMLNFSVLPEAGEFDYTKEQLFEAIWSRLVEQLERMS
jgi:hypothetical protein